MALAVRWGCRFDNPATGSQKQHEAPRERLPSNEVHDALLKALDDNPGPTSDAIRLLALTGARPKELLSAKWEDFDLKQGVTGSSPVIGTKISSIRLTDNEDEVDCRHDKIKGLVLRVEFLKKA